MKSLILFSCVFFTVCAGENVSVYPYSNDCSTLVYTWSPKGADTKYALDHIVGHENAPSWRANIPADNTMKDPGFFVFNKPVRPGKSYILSYWAKGANINANSKVIASFIGQSEKGNIGGYLLLKPDPLEDIWQKYEATVTIPSAGGWRDCVKMQFGLSFTDVNGATVWFDDVSITER